MEHECQFHFGWCVCCLCILLPSETWEKIADLHFSTLVCISTFFALLSPLTVLFSQCSHTESMTSDLFLFLLFLFFCTILWPLFYLPFHRHRFVVVVFASPHFSSPSVLLLICSASSVLLFSICLSSFPHSSAIAFVHACHNIHSPSL